MIEVYTDGSCIDQIGGYAFVVCRNRQIIYSYSDSENNTTNNKMELQAIISALEYLQREDMINNAITLFSDSTYCIKGIQEWIYSWMNSNWRTSNKEPVKNQDYWKCFLALKNQFSNLDFQWIYGHNGNLFNEHVDKLARGAVIKYKLNNR